MPSHFCERRALNYELAVQAKLPMPWRVRSSPPRARCGTPRVWQIARRCLLVSRPLKIRFVEPNCEGLE
jgi:hypothetical protein